MRITLILTATVLLLLHNCVVTSKGALTSIAQEKDRLAQVDKRPELGVSMPDVARFKIASRKTNYRAGDMISVDLALLNTSGNSIYFHRLSMPQVYLTDRNGNKKFIPRYLIRDVTPTPQTYVLLRPNSMISASYQLLVGCDRRGFEQANAQIYAKDGKSAFDDNRFINWGDSCLNLDEAGTYKLTVEISNWFVVVSSDQGGVQTAVGTLQSNPLTINLSK